MFIKKSPTPLLLSVQKIWNEAPHNALTDLVVYKKCWFCIFREGERHVNEKHGQIRILKSTNGITWINEGVIELKDTDLRDPKLSITPDGRLMLLAGGTHHPEKRNQLFHQSYVSFSEDGKIWEPLIPILPYFEWLWRITWFQGKAYGISYRFSDPSNRKSEWVTTLWESSDGIDFTPLTTFQIPGYPNEATIRFKQNGEMIVLQRRDERENGYAWLGNSFPPYEDWLWRELGYYFGGPNFLILPEEQIWASGRILIHTLYGLQEKTVLARLTEETLIPQLILPSGGDCSYPGMAYHEGFLYISYYSSHEGSAAIYFAKVDLPLING